MARKNGKPGVYVSLRDRQSSRTLGHLTLEALTASKALAILRKADRQELLRKLQTEAA